MASKTYPSSSGYFNKKMLAILESDTKKPESKKTTSNTSKKNKQQEKISVMRGSAYGCGRNGNC